VIFCGGERYCSYCVGWIFLSYEKSGFECAIHHIPFENNGIQYPAGTSIENYSKDKVYVYISPKIKREKI